MRIMTKHQPLDNGRTLELAVCYSLGGQNYFYNQVSGRGYYVHFTNCEINGQFKSYSMFSDDNFKILARPVKRQNKKVELEMKDFLIRNEEELARLYRIGDKDSLFKLIKERS